MLKAATIALMILAPLAGAQEIKKVPIQPTSATSGKDMFAEYCAVCHGNSGRGDGPAATAFKKRAADLTQLARKNDGVFPELHVINFIAGEDAAGAHGTRDMPVWGDLFRSLDPGNRDVAQLRLNNLMDYVKGLQAR
jgi:mono/diheme cytochrome c family protein